MSSSHPTRMYCPLCTSEIPVEDKEIASPEGERLVAQVQCRGCQKAFTICEEEKLLRLREFGKPVHPEDRT